MENRVFPDLDDIVNRLQLRPWLDAPARSITTQSYGSQLLWRYLDERYPPLLPAYLTTLASTTVRDEGRRAFVTTFGRIANTTFRSVFRDFAVFAAQEYGSEIAPAGTVRRRFAASVAPFAIHYLRLSRLAARVSVLVRGGGAAVMYERASDVAANPAAFRRLRSPRVGRGGARCFTIPRRRSSAFLVLANADAARALRYVVRAIPETGRC